MEVKITKDHVNARLLSVVTDTNSTLIRSICNIIKTNPDHIPISDAERIVETLTIMHDYNLRPKPAATYVFGPARVGSLSRDASVARGASAD